VLRPEEIKGPICYGLSTEHRENLWQRVNEFQLKMCHLEFINRSTLMLIVDEINHKSYNYYGFSVLLYFSPFLFLFLLLSMLRSEWGYNFTFLYPEEYDIWVYAISISFFVLIAVIAVCIRTTVVYEVNKEHFNGKPVFNWQVTRRDDATTCDILLDDTGSTRIEFFTFTFLPAV
jgi:hypothetical protein